MTSCTTESNKAPPDSWAATAAAHQHAASIARDIAQLTDPLAAASPELQAAHEQLGRWERSRIRGIEQEREQQLRDAVQHAEWLKRGIIHDGPLPRTARGMRQQLAAERAARAQLLAENPQARLPQTGRELAQLARGNGSGAPDSAPWAQQLQKLLRDPGAKLKLAQQLASEPSNGMGRLDPATGELVGWREPAAAAVDLRPTWQQTIYASAPAVALALAVPPLELQAALEAAGVSRLRKRADGRNYRRDRRQIRGGLRVHSHTSRLQKCGAMLLAQASGATLMQSAERGSHFSGLMQCGLLWICPVCSEKIGQGRQAQVMQLLERHFSEGRAGAFLTLTIRHHMGEQLRELRAAVGQLYRSLWAGRESQYLRKAYGLIGHVRAMEVTYGANGWHPHLHVLLLFDGPVTPEQIEQLREKLAARWIAGAERLGLTAPLDEQQHCKIINNPAAAAEYISKLGAAQEITGWSHKTSDAIAEKSKQERGRHPFQIFADFMKHGRPEDLAIWHEWEKGIKGARFLTWSRGLKQRYAITNKTDQELADAEEAAADTHPVLHVNKQLLKSLMRVKDLDTDLLDAAELLPTSGAVALWLCAHIPDAALLPGAAITAIWDSALLRDVERMRKRHPLLATTEILAG